MALTPTANPLRSIVASVALAAPTLAGGAVIVGGPANVGYPDLQSAIDAAVDGDVILVGAGTYPGFTIDDESLAIFAAPGAVVSCEGPVTVRNLATTRTVVLSGLRIGPAPGASQPSVAALTLDGDLGHVRVQDCELTGFPIVASAGAFVRNSPRVAFANCTLVGGKGFDDSTIFASGGPGGRGIHAQASSLALYDCLVTGGVGGHADDAGDGGVGLLVAPPASFVFASGSTFTGGVGGDTFGLGSDGTGGAGIELDSSATVKLVDSPAQGGAGGGGSAYVGPDIVDFGGTLVQLDGTARSLATTRVLQDVAARETLTVTGEPGDRVFLASSIRPGFGATQLGSGVWLVPFPAKLTVTPLGTISATGSIDVTLAVGDLPSSVPSALFVRQVYVLDALGNAWLTGAAHELVANRAAAPDCDADGVADPVACFDGTTADCDTSLIPDECELAAGTKPDCNSNAIPDSCDIADGTSLDGNSNQVPDECEFGGDTVYVDDSAPPGGDGSLAHPFQAIKDGVAFAAPGMKVLVLDGFYVGTENRDIDFLGKALTVASQNGPGACIIECASLGRAFVVDSVVGADARIEGFTIRNGKPPVPGSGFLKLYGGSVLVQSSTAQIVNCVVSGSRSAVDGSGGAIASNVSDLTIDGCAFIGAIADSGNGGAIASWGGLFDNTLAVRRSSFNACSGGVGGAVIFSGLSSTFVHSTFVDNGHGFGTIDTQSGGALNVSGSFLRVDDCLFVGNDALNSGGAISTGAQGRISNSTFSGNRVLGVNGYGGAVSHDQSWIHPLVIANCLAWNNSAAHGTELANFDGVVQVSYSDLQGGLLAIYDADTVQWGNGNLSVDPKFADADGPDNDPWTFVDNVYRLTTTSPCLDAGDNTAIEPDVLDIDGDGDTNEPTPLDLNLKPRRADLPLVPDTGFGAAPIVDIGCYERQS